MKSGHNKNKKISDGCQHKEEKVGNREKRMIKGSSHEDLTQSIKGNVVRRNSIRRSKTDHDLRSLLLSDNLARDYVTPYLRMKMQQRLKHKHGSKFSLQSSPSCSSSSIRSAQSSTVTEQILHRSTKEVQKLTNYIPHT